MRNWIAIIFFGVAVTTLTTLTACSDKGSNNAPAGGTIIISTAGDADVLFPPLVSTSTAKQVIDLVFERLAELKSDMNAINDSDYEPRIAEHWMWSADSLSIAFHLNPDAKWHDGKAVTSRDVKFTYEINKDSTSGSSSGPLIANIDSVSTPDSLTAVFWFKKRYPLQFFDAVYQMSIVPEHVYGRIPRAQLRSDSTLRHPVGSGKYRFESWKPGASLTLVADTLHYRGRPNIDRIVWSISPDFNTAQTRFLAGEADIFEALRFDMIPEIQKNPNLKIITYPGLDYAFMLLNLHKPQFANRDVRRALVMALDRQALIKNVFDTMAVLPVGPTVRAYATTDATLPQLPYDTAQAFKVLKNKPFTFTILVPSSSKNRVRMAVLIQEQLKKAGITVNIEEADFKTFGARLNRRDFDAAISAWHADAAPGGVRQTWSTEASRNPDGLNFGSYESAEFDAHVDSALATANVADAKAHFSKAYTVANNDVPAIWLYEPRATLVMHKRIKNTALRPDSWWADMEQWSIPENERIPRDKIGR